MSKDYPAQYGNSPQYRNPEGTVPFPRPADMPVPLWQQTNTPATWVGPTALPDANDPWAEPGVDYTWTWKAPTFDLQPQLRSSDSQAREGATPIWRRDARLYFSIQGATNQFQATTPWDDIHIYVQHFGNVMTNHVGGAARATVVAISARTLVTNTMMTSAALDSAPYSNTINLTIAPPGTGSGGGDGYPIRYWSPRVTFRKVYSTARFPNGGAPPPITFYAVYY